MSTPERETPLLDLFILIYKNLKQLLIINTAPFEGSNCDTQLIRNFVNDIVVPRIVLHGLRRCPAVHQYDFTTTVRCK